MFIFASIQNALFKIQVEGDNIEGQKYFKLDDVDAIARYLKQFKQQNSIATSSSIDFPEEDGAPKDFDARATLQKAMNLAWHTNL